jgi:hypothetical protein
MHVPTKVRSAIQLLGTASLLVACSAATANAQWTRRHPTVICASHHTSDQPDSGVSQVRGEAVLTLTASHLAVCGRAVVVKHDSDRASSARPLTASSRFAETRSALP